MPDPATRAIAFVDDVVRPSLEAWEASGTFPRDAVRASGLTGLFAPTAVGGLACGYPEAAAVFEALGRGDAALAFALSMHNAVAAAIGGVPDGHPAARWAVPLATGAALGGFSLTEPHAGSDATAITTRATPVGDGWTLRGTKAWVSLGGVADVILVVARTADGPGHADVAILALPTDDPRVRFSAPYRKAAAAFLPIAEMELADAPATLLVPPGAGMRAALAAIDVARFDIAAIANGLHAEALDVAVAYVARRQAFGRPLLEQQGLAWALADVATDLEAARALTLRAARLLGTPDGRVAVAHAKRFGPDAALAAANACSAALGAYGWLHDHPLARLAAEAAMLRTVDGTAEVQRIVIARDLAARARG